MLHPGLYEQLINRALRQELDAIPSERKTVISVGPTEAAEVLSRYIEEALKKALSGSRPMSIVWELHQEIPAKFLQKTQQVMG